MTLEEMADELRKAGWRVKPPISQATCLHVNRFGNGRIGADGSCRFEWHCPECGKNDLTETEATHVPFDISTIPRNGLGA